MLVCKSHKPSNRYHTYTDEVAMIQFQQLLMISQSCYYLLEHLFHSKGQFFTNFYLLLPINWTGTSVIKDFHIYFSSLWADVCFLHNYLKIRFVRNSAWNQTWRPEIHICFSKGPFTFLPLSDLCMFIPLNVKVYKPLNSVVTERSVWAEHAV